MCEQKILIRKFDPKHFKKYSMRSLIFMLTSAGYDFMTCFECSADNPRSDCPFRYDNLQLPEHVLKHPDSPFYQKMVISNPGVLTEEYVKKVEDEVWVTIAELSEHGDWTQEFTSSCYLKEIRGLTYSQT